MVTDIHIPFDTTSIPAYFTTPDILNKYPAIILIPEIWGVNDNIKNITDRFQQQGYAVLVPNLLSETQMTNAVGKEIFEQLQNPATKNEAQKKMRIALSPLASPGFAEDAIEKLKICFGYLQQSLETLMETMLFSFSSVLHFLWQDSAVVQKS